MFVMHRRESFSFNSIFYFSVSLAVRYTYILLRYFSINNMEESNTLEGFLLKNGLGNYLRNFEGNSFSVGKKTCVQKNSSSSTFPKSL